MQRILISKESTPKTLDEKISVYLESSDVSSYVELLRKTWPRTMVEAQPILRKA